MSTLTAERFSEFFRAVYAYDPFPWQAALAERVAQGDWPSLLDLPTASGKTAVLDVAVFALACQATWPVEKRTAPRRIFFVVDRRVIVDEAFSRANNLADKLAEAKSGILHEVAMALRALAQADTPLLCYQLRGGMYRDDTWARSPLQPAILTSTVDQTGSRLLFRSYGAGAKVWPIHAGLTANDALIILDEAHCAQPFQQTMEWVQRYRQWGDVKLPLPFRFVIMTATPPTAAADVFHLSRADYENDTLNKRLIAAKPARLVVAETDEEAEESEHRAALVKCLTSEATRLAQRPALKAIGIIVNRVATARQVHASLLAQGHRAYLLIGRMRPFDRDRVLRDEVFRLTLAANSPKRQLVEPLFVVATQTLEVGANLDFDGLVSECASLDAVRQRFGRLNRLGRALAAQGVLVIRADQAKDSADDPVYGAALCETWKWLKRLAAPMASGKKKGGKRKTTAPAEVEVDMGIMALAPALEHLGDDRQRLLVAPVDAPVMLPAHIDAWVQTSPAPLPEPEVAVFLHGPQRGVPEVQLVWRADLPAADGEDAEALWTETVTLCPPTSTEALTAPLYLVRQWLQRVNSERINHDDDFSDVEGEVMQKREGRDEAHRAGRPVLLWDGPEDSVLTTNPAEVTPGATLVIPAAYGGWEVFGHLLHPEAPDIAEEARWQARRERVWRLHPNVLKAWPEGDTKTQLQALAAQEEPPTSDDVRAALESDDSIAELLATLKLSKPVAHPAGGWVISGESKGAERIAALPAFTDEDDSPSFLPRRTDRRVSLQEHTDGVTAFAVRFAEACGLSTEMVEDFRWTGRFHDVGKADPRFQLWLALVSGARQVNGLLAKSAPASPAQTWAAHARSGYPRGARHELLSVRLVESAPDSLQQARDRDLVLHLIASHHGRCRPFAPVIADLRPVEVGLTLFGQTLHHSSDTRLERLDSGVPQRFWALTRRYGWWGLAYLEAVFRLADWQQSARDTQTVGG